MTEGKRGKQRREKGAAQMMTEIRIKQFLAGMFALLVLSACATTDQTRTRHVLQPEKNTAAMPDAAPPAQTTPLPVSPAPAVTDYGRLVKVVASADVLFGFASTRLGVEGTQFLDTIAEELQHTSYESRVIGHADRIGTQARNLKLSLRRAEAVKIYLLSKGMDKDLILTEGMGEAYPVTGDACPASMRGKALIDCLAPDRRVEIRLK